MSNQTVDYQRLLGLAHEFEKRWRALQAYYLDAAAGFHLVRREADRERDFILGLGSDGDLDPLEFVDEVQWGYETIFSEPFCTSSIHRATLAEVRARNAESGRNFIELGNQVLVSFYTFWDEYLRREYVVAKGLLAASERGASIVEKALQEHASFDLWGDLRLIRHDIVHHGAISSRDKAARCRLIKWFPEGAQIALSPKQVRALLLALLRFHGDLYAEALPRSPRIIIGKPRF